MDRLARLIAYRPALILILGTALTVFFAAQLIDLQQLQPRLRIETEIEKLLPEGGADREFYAHFRDIFGNYEMVFIGITGADVFTPESLDRLHRLTHRLEQIDGVRRVLSLSNATGIRSENGDVRIAAAFDEVPEDPEQLSSLRQRVLGDPMIAGNLVDHSGRATALLVYPEEMSEHEFRSRGIDQEIERVAREVVGADAEVLVAGNPVLKATTGRILLRDVSLLVPLSFAFMAVVGFFSFRSLSGALIPLLSIGIAQIWTAGTMVLFERSLNLVTFIVPILINALGFAYSVHLVSEHAQALKEGRTGGDAAYHGLKRVAFPLFLTALTTAAGFMSLCLSRIPAIREFGAFCVVGVVSSLVASLTLAPALLSLARHRVRAPDPSTSTDGNHWIERMASRLAAFDLRHRLGILVAGGALTVVALIGVMRIEVSTSFVTNLKKSNPLRQASVAFDQELGGSTTFHLALESGSKDFFKYPANLEIVRSLQQWLDEQPEVSKTTSIADYLMVVNRAFHEEDSAHFGLPETKRAVSQFLFFFWNDGLRDLITPKYDAVHILIRSPSLNSQRINGFVDRVEERLQALPEPLTGHVTGDTVLIGRTMDEIAWGQAVSLTGAVFIIYIILAIYFRSLWIGFLAMLPNTLPVTVYFGTLGLTGVTLNIITSLIACIVLGIAVDDTIHLLVRFREKFAELGDQKRAVVAALHSVIRPVTSSTAALCAGFLVLAASGLRHQVEFAVLSSCMLVFAWLLDVTFTPALCAGMHLPAPSGSSTTPPPGIAVAGDGARHGPPPA